MDELAGQDVVVVEWTDPGGTGWIAPPHVHHEDDEAWYVVEGTLRFRLGDRVVDVPAGSACSPLAALRTRTGTPRPSRRATSWS